MRNTGVPAKKEKGRIRFLEPGLIKMSAPGDARSGWIDGWKLPNLNPPRSEFTKEVKLTD